MLHAMTASHSVGIAILTSLLILTRFTVGDQSLHESVGPCIVQSKKISSNTLEHSGFAEFYLNGVSM